MKAVKIWDSFKIKKDTYFLWQAGQSKLAIGNEKGSFVTALEETKESLKTSVNSSNDSSTIKSLTEWKYAMVSDQCWGVKITPILPDLPLVVLPDPPIDLAINGEALTLVHIPAWAEVTLLGGKHNAMLYTFPVERLNRGWVGTPLAGEMSYRLKTTIDRTERTNVLPYSILCPVLLSNRSKASFSLKNFYIDSSNLNLYSTKDYFWTSPVMVTHFGERNGVKHHYSTKAPSQASQTTLLRKAPGRGDKVKVRDNREKLRFNQKIKFQLIPNT